MLRSRKQQQQQQQQQSAAISSNNDTNNDDPRIGGDRHSKKSIIPKSLIGTLIVASVLFLVLLFSGSLSKSNDSSGGGGGDQDVDGANSGIDSKKQLRNAAANNNNNNDINIKNKSSQTITSTTTKLIDTNDDTIGTTSPTTGSTLHIIFSTDCSTFQHWQSYLFFHRAYTIQQPGYITRIASGCTPTELQYEQLWHNERIAKTMSTRFRIHFTPHFSGVKDELTGEVTGDYKFFNKPFGLKHFLEHDELLGLQEEEEEEVVVSNNNNNNNEMMKQMKHPNDVIILCDPDFALLRPITDDFSNPRETLVGPRRKAYFNTMSSHIVSHGHPYAQTYGLGTQWRKFDLDTITGMTNSPAKDVNQKDGGIFYPAGPPYIGTASDMYKIAVKWSEFAPRVHKEYPHLLAEMYAYCIAAAHVQLPHTLIDSLMISSAGIGGEGWKFIQAIPPSETCTFATNPDHNIRPIPTLLHYCQRYIVDGNKYLWTKRKIPHGIFSCDHPLLVEPPLDIGQSVDHTDKDRMNAFMICALTKFTNDAMIFFKDHHCSSENGGNRERTMDLAATMTNKKYGKGERAF